MSDTITVRCEVCNSQFDYLPSAGLDKVCDECAEKDGATFTDHYHETITHRELNSGLI